MLLPNRPRSFLFRISQYATVTGSHNVMQRLDDYVLEMHIGPQSF